MMHYYGYGAYGYDPLFGFFHLIGGVIFVVIVVLIVALIFRSGGPRRWHRWNTHSALSILNERFAKGEIDKPEYEERRKALLGEK